MKNLVALLAIVPMLLVIPFAHASASEQVVFSGAGVDNFSGTTTPFGFWIWCEAESANPYITECAGSMYFYNLHLVKHVDDTAPIQEKGDGQYFITVGSDDGTVACTLLNMLPNTRGPTNTVQVDCTAPSGSGSSTNAVVSVTGP